MQSLFIRRPLTLRVRQFDDDVGGMRFGSIQTRGYVKVPSFHSLDADDADNADKL